MPDNNINQNNNAAVSAASVQPVNSTPAQPVQAIPQSTPPANQQTPIDSPWNEPLPVEPPKTQVSGTLAGAPAQAFSVPQNIEKTMPPVVKATDIVQLTAQPTPQPVAQTPSKPIDSVSKPEPVFDYHFDIPTPGAIPATPNQPVNNEISAPAQNTPAVAPVQPTAPVPGGVAALVKNPVAGSQPQAVPAVPAPVAPQPIAPTAIPASQPVVPPPIQPLALIADVSATPMPASPVQQNQGQTFVVPSSIPADAPAVPSATPPVQQPKKIGLSKLFSGLKRKPDPSAANESLVPPTEAVSQSKSRLKVFFYIVLAFIIIMTGLVYLTEIGFLSIGLEKVYGATGIQRVWGGLSSDSETALIQSFTAMKDHQQFKVSGTINMNIDKTMKNTVTTPLVSEGTVANKLAILPIKAILVAETYLPAEDDPSVIWVDETDVSTDTGSDTTSDISSDTTSDTGLDTTSDTSSENSSVTETTTSSDTASTDDAEASLGDTQSVYTDTSTTKNINTSIEGSFGSSGSEIQIKIVKPLDSETISLKNSQNNLWVKSDRIKFDSSVEQGKWLLYNLASLGETGFVTQALSIDSTKGYSTEGVRAANEKVGSTRCYKYSLENMELGDSLSDIGIASDSIQNITGTIWIGVKDKLIRRLDLVVTTSPSSPIIQINLSLLFSGYDTGNNFSEPASSEVIKATTTE